MRRIKLVLAIAGMAVLLVAFASPALAKDRNNHNWNNRWNDGWNSNYSYPYYNNYSYPYYNNYSYPYYNNYSDLNSPCFPFCNNYYGNNYYGYNGW
jgi:hypothetical protein